MPLAPPIRAVLYGGPFDGYTLVVPQATFRIRPISDRSPERPLYVWAHRTEKRSGRWVLALSPETATASNT